MRRLRAWWHRAVGLFSARRAREFDAELESHLELHIEDNLRRGMSPEEARRQALVALGGLQAIREAYRDRSGIPAIAAIAQDVRFAGRMLRKAPAFTAAAILILAIGVGANAAVFSLINAALLRPAIPGMRHDALVGVYAGDRTRPDFFRLFSYDEYLALRDRSATFAGLLAEGWLRAGITENGRTEPLEPMFVSSNYFSVLKLPLALGRTFTPDEERPLSGAAVAIVSEAFWRQHGGTPDILGRRLTINGQTITVVGVAPKGFHGTMPVMSTNIWLPLGARRLMLAGPESLSSRAPALLLSGVLANGVSIRAAEARLGPITAGVAAADVPQPSDLRLVVRERSRTGRSPAPRSDNGATAGAAVLMGLAGLVLLVACLNLANMLLARGAARRQEIAVRLALGGTRYRLVRQFVIEGLILAALGSGAAMLMSWWAAERFLASLSARLPFPIALDVSPDARVIAIVFIAAVVSTVIFSLGPAWRLSRPQLATAMKAAGPEPGTRRSRTALPSLLVASQVALSLALLVSAGVFMRSGTRAESRDPGFPLSGELLAHLDGGLIGRSEADVRAAYDAVLQRVRTLPGVADASLASIVPFGNDSEGVLLRPTGRQDTAPMVATYTVIGAHYFRALGLPLIQGREFSETAEGEAGAPIAIIDTLLADRLFGGGNAIGRIVHTSNWDGSPGDALQIVGVVPTVRDDIMEAADRGHVYVPFGNVYRGQMTLHVKVAPGTESSMIERVRQSIRDVDERLPVVAMRTFEQHRDESMSLWGTIFAARLFTGFGMIALVLATVGVYGLRAYLVMRRTREIGIRVALGATRPGIVSQLLREGSRTAAAGMLAGLVIAIGLVGILRSSGMLFDVDIFDPLVFGGAALVLAAATAAASYLPARRALRVDPAVALRPE
jgi:predicted permease